MITFIIWDVSPEVFDGFPFRWYSLCWLIGIVLGRWILISIYRSDSTPHADVDRLTLYMILGGIVGARLGHILFYDPIHYLNHPIEILPVRLTPEFEFTGLAGLASHGGVIGALIALYFYQRKSDRRYLWLLDRLIIAGAMLGTCIRFGNLMNSEIVGVPTDVSWAFVFTRVDSLPRHPTQIYEALFYLMICAALYLVWRSGKFSDRTGFVFRLGIVLIFTLRFFVEFLKENQVAFEDNLTLNMGQLLSIPVVVLGVILMTRSGGSKANMINQDNYRLE